MLVVDAAGVSADFDGMSSRVGRCAGSLLSLFVCGRAGDVSEGDHVSIVLVKPCLI